MNNKEQTDISEIARHVNILNTEVGSLKTDVGEIKINLKWIKRVMYYMGTIVSIGVGKIIFFSGG